MLELKNKKLAPLFLFFAALMWSTSGIFTKTVAWNGLCLATLRGVIAFTASAILLRGRKIRLNRQKVLASFCYFVQGTLFMCANKYTTAANATVLQNTSPLWIILFACAALAAQRKAKLCTAASGVLALWISYQLGPCTLARYILPLFCIAPAMLCGAFSLYSSPRR